MRDELISKQKILNTLKEWQGEDLPATLYGDGYEDAVSDIIRLIETEVPVRAVELPCKIGDTLYWILTIPKILILCVEVESFTLYKGRTFIDIRSKQSPHDVYGICANQLGKYLFFTREEAEAALRKMKGENK